ncbi:MAG: PilX N-terminal domain-containing pilus assembly protein [Gallionella sp.]|nr:PilX N-terminal domain-containing pilus assembly protein [Gallionella sp.]
MCRAATHNHQSSVLCPLSSERGSTLVISLIILIVLMLLGVMAMNTSDTQYKLAGNLQFEDVAMNNAEQAVNAAERWLEASAALAPSAASAVNINPMTMTWTDSDIPPSTMVNDKQRYIIGHVSTSRMPSAAVGLVCPDPTGLQNFNCVHTYLITARGLGGRGATKFVQEYFSVTIP